MTERAKRLVEHILRVAKPNQELFSHMTVGPETEDTTYWTLTGRGDVEVSEDTVYPAMARVAGETRTISVDEAKRQILAALLQEDTDGSLVPYFERQWKLE